MSQSIEKLCEADRQAERMGRAMALAFRQEPNFTYMLTGHDARERPLTWFFGSFVAGIGLRCGEVFTASGGAGGAVWIRPGASVSLWGALRSGLLALPLHFGLGGARRSMALDMHVERVRKSVAPPFHWYLAALGVHPEEQGQGLGSALLQPVLARADDHGLPCYLETFRERTAGFYGRFGFGVVHTDAIPEGPPFWCMIRKPRT